MVVIELLIPIIWIKVVSIETSNHGNDINLYNFKHIHALNDDLIFNVMLFFCKYSCLIFKSLIFLIFHKYENRSVFISHFSLWLHDKRKIESSFHTSITAFYKKIENIWEKFVRKKCLKRTPKLILYSFDENHFPT